MTAARAPIALPLPSADPSRALTLDEVAARLHISRRQVRRLTLRDFRPLPAVMLGERAVRVREATLIEWLRQEELMG